MNAAHTCLNLSSCRFSPLFYVTFCVRCIESITEQLTIMFRFYHCIADMTITSENVCMLLIWRRCSLWQRCQFRNGKIEWELEENENRFDTILTSFGAKDKNHNGNKFAHIHDGGIRHSVNRKRHRAIRVDECLEQREKRARKIERKRNIWWHKSHASTMMHAYTTRKGFAYPLFMVCNAGLYKSSESYEWWMEMK